MIRHRKCRRSHAHKEHTYSSGYSPRNAQRRRRQPRHWYGLDENPCCKCCGLSCKTRRNRSMKSISSGVGEHRTTFGLPTTGITGQSIDEGKTYNTVLQCMEGFNLDNSPANRNWKPSVFAFNISHGRITKRPIFALNLLLQDASNETSIRTVLAELCVYARCCCTVYLVINLSLRDC